MDGPGPQIRTDQMDLDRRRPGRRPEAAEKEDMWIDVQEDKL